MSLEHSSEEGHLKVMQPLHSSRSRSKKKKGSGKMMAALGGGAPSDDMDVCSVKSGASVRSTQSRGHRRTKESKNKSPGGLKATKGGGGSKHQKMSL